MHGKATNTVNSHKAKAEIILQDKMDHNTINQKGLTIAKLSKSDLKQAQLLKESEIQPKDARTILFKVLHTATRQVSVKEKGASIKPAAKQEATPGFTRAKW